MATQASATTHDDDHPRDHARDHDHPHDHPHDHEAGRPPEGGPVVVDIGGDIGALIVLLDRDRVGRELHVRREGDAPTTHTGIWERRLGAQQIVVAVFPALLEGRYEVVGDHGATPTITIRGGIVTEHDLRSG